jgi:hypothetical protein
MREPHKFPMALTGVMAFLLCKYSTLIPPRSKNSRAVHLMASVCRPIRWRRRPRLPHLRLGHPDGRAREPEPAEQDGADGAVFLRVRDPALRAAAALPRGAHPRERAVHAQRQGGRAREVAQEQLPLRDGACVHGGQLGRRGGPG